MEKKNYYLDDANEDLYSQMITRILITLPKPRRLAEVQKVNDPMYCNHHCLVNTISAIDLSLITSYKVCLTMMTSHLTPKRCCSNYKLGYYIRSNWWGFRRQWVHCSSKRWRHTRLTDFFITTRIFLRVFFCEKSKIPYFVKLINPIRWEVFVDFIFFVNGCVIFKCWISRIWPCMIWSRFDQVVSSLVTLYCRQLGFFPLSIQFFLL